MLLETDCFVCERECSIFESVSRLLFEEPAYVKRRNRWQTNLVSISICFECLGSSMPYMKAVDKSVSLLTLVPTELRRHMIQSHKFTFRVKLGREFGEPQNALKILSDPLLPQMTIERKLLMTRANFTQLFPQTGEVLIHLEDCDQKVTVKYKSIKVQFQGGTGGMIEKVVLDGVESSHKVHATR